MSNPKDLEAGKESPGTAVSKQPSSDTLGEFFVSEGERQANASIGGAGMFAPGVSTGSETADLLAFWVAEEEYAVDIVEIQEIIKVPQITDVPRPAPGVVGIFSLRGTIVPVVDLRTLLQLPTQDFTNQSRILVLRGGGEPLGLVVDSVSSVVRLDRDAIEAVPRTMQDIASDLLHGVGRDGDRMLIILELDALLNVLEAVA